MRSACRCISATGVRQASGISGSSAQRVDVAADDRQRRPQLVRRVGHEVAPRSLELYLVRDVADDREALVLAVGNDLHREPAAVVFRRGHGNAIRLRRREVCAETGVPKQVVDPIADVGGGLEPEQSGRGRVEPDDLAIGVQDDAAVAERAGALADLAQQPMVFLLAAARLGAKLVYARKDLGPKARASRTVARACARRARDRARTDDAACRRHRAAARRPATNRCRRTTSQAAAPRRANRSTRRDGEIQRCGRSSHVCCGENR